jgi:hypothetical protein
VELQQAIDEAHFTTGQVEGTHDDMYGLPATGPLATRDTTANVAASTSPS